MRAQRLFHDHATAEWDEKAGLYLTGRASAKEFIEGVRSRVGDVWRPYLELHVLRLFFRAKKNGLPDTYQKVKHFARYQGVMVEKTFLLFGRNGLVLNVSSVDTFLLVCLP